MPRNANAEKRTALDQTPLFNPHRGKFTEFAACMIETPVHADYVSYEEFIERKTGVKPEPGAIVSAALELYFQSDTLFQAEVKNGKKLTSAREPNNSRDAVKSATHDGAVAGAK